MEKGIFVVNKPIIIIDEEKLQKNRISFEELRKYLPRYIFSPIPLHYGWLKKVWFWIVQLFLRTLVKVFLRPRKIAGILNQAEIDKVYTKEAGTYNRKHHLTTRGMDLVWRRMMGWFVVVVGRNKPERLRILDICTGTGLVIKEIISILKEWGISAEFIGLDYNVDMLARAEKSIGAISNVRFVRGDAMDLVNHNRVESSMATFVPNSIDIVTQMFGIGGIPEPLKVFDGVLRILKPGGQLFMIDMHKPIPEQPGEWPFLLKWCRFPVLEMVTYEQSTIPLVLNRLWGWRDPTMSFYLLLLVTYQDKDSRYWGFRVQLFEQESQRWWFALPLMPVAKIIIEKVEIDAKTAGIRKTILEACTLTE